MAQDEAPTPEPRVVPAATPPAGDLEPHSLDSHLESADPSVAGSMSAAAALDPAAIEELLKGASFEDPASLVADAMPSDEIGGLPPLDPDNFKLPNFQQVLQDAQVSSFDLLRDVELNVKIELGRARMLVEDVLKLSEGSVVELDKLAGDPVDVFVNDRLVARGEVLVLNDNFCVRVNEIVAGVKEEGV